MQLKMQIGSARLLRTVGALDSATLETIKSKAPEPHRRATWTGRKWFLQLLDDLEEPPSSASRSQTQHRQRQGDTH